MRKLKYVISVFLVIGFISVSFFGAIAQNKEMKAKDVPKDVIEVLNKYLEILSTSSSVDEAGKKMIEADILGGHLTNGAGTEASGDILQFSLKKDFDNVKFYGQPAVITRVLFSPNDYDGFKETLFEGDRYKIWIKKKEGVAGMPAPIPIIKPKEGKPKVVSTIGSL